MEQPAAPEHEFEARLRDFERTVQQSRDEVAAYAAGIHCLREHLQQLEQAQVAHTAQHLQQIAEKRTELTQSQQVYERLTRALARLEEQLDAAKRKQADLQTRALLKGQDDNG